VKFEVFIGVNIYIFKHWKCYWYGRSRYCHSSDLRNNVLFVDVLQINCEKRLIFFSCLCMEHLGSHWTDFHGPLCRGFLIKYVDED
jgi:hypothetical protein